MALSVREGPKALEQFGKNLSAYQARKTIVPHLERSLALPLPREQSRGVHSYMSTVEKQAKVKLSPQHYRLENVDQLAGFQKDPKRIKHTFVSREERGISMRDFTNK